MNPADWFAAGLGGVAGGALVWHFKTWFVSIGRKAVSLFKGAQYLAAKTRADVAALETKLAAAKAAVTK